MRMRRAGAPWRGARRAAPTARLDAPFEGGAPRGPARWVARGLDLVAIAASVAVAGLMLFLVVARYVLGLSIVGLHELILASALLLYMTGALIASRRREHLTVDWLAGRLVAPRARALHGGLVASRHRGRGRILRRLVVGHDRLGPRAAAGDAGLPHPRLDPAASHPRRGRWAASSTPCATSWTRAAPCCGADGGAARAGAAGPADGARRAGGLVLRGGAGLPHDPLRRQPRHPDAPGLPLARLA